MKSLFKTNLKNTFRNPYHYFLFGNCFQGKKKKGNKKEKKANQIKPKEHSS